MHVRPSSISVLADLPRSSTVLNTKKSLFCIHVIFLQYSYSLPAVFPKSAEAAHECYQCLAAAFTEALAASCGIPGGNLTHQKAKKQVWIDFACIFISR